jgi:hypothetical protein
MRGGGAHYGMDGVWSSASPCWMACSRSCTGIYPTPFGSSAVASTICRSFHCGARFASS